MHKLIIFFLSIFSIIVCGQAPTATSMDTIIIKSKNKLVHTDSLLKKTYNSNNILTNRSFSPNYQKKYKDLDYQNHKDHTSLSDKILEVLYQFLEKIFANAPDQKPSTKTFNIVIKIIVWAAIAFLIYFIITKVLLKDGHYIFSKRNKKLKINSEEIYENIHEIDFEKSIASFEKDKNYRFAIRYLFLNYLKNLSNQNLIDWNVEKTNSDYSKELKDATKQQQFNRLVYIFENIWYGEIEIDEAQYTAYKSYFNNYK